MDSYQLKIKMAELLGFVVTERQNDAVLEFYAEPISALSGPKIRAVRPATREEVSMFTSLLGFVRRMGDVVDENNRMRDELNNWMGLVSEKDVVISKLEKAVETMAMALQKADVTIKDLISENELLRSELKQGGE